MRIRQIREFLHDFPWLHMGVGLFGNLTFVVGSFFFLSDRLMIAGTWLFILGSLGMFFGVCGEIFVRYEHHQRKKAAENSPVTASVSASSAT